MPTSIKEDMELLVHYAVSSGPLLAVVPAPSAERALVTALLQSATCQGPRHSAMATVVAPKRGPRWFCVADVAARHRLAYYTE